MEEKRERWEDDFILMSFFDLFMFKGNGFLIWVNYYLIMISGPLDICKTYTLKENKIIFGLMVCMTAAIKLIIEALVYDQFIVYVVNNTFSVRLWSLVVANTLSIFILGPIVIDELNEIKNSESNN